MQMSFSGCEDLNAREGRKEVTHERTQLRAVRLANDTNPVGTSANCKSAGDSRVEAGMG